MPSCCSPAAQAPARPLLRGMAPAWAASWGAGAPADGRRGRGHRHGRAPPPVGAARRRCWDLPTVAAAAAAHRQTGLPAAPAPLVPPVQERPRTQQQAPPLAAGSAPARAAAPPQRLLLRECRPLGPLPEPAAVAAPPPGLAQPRPAGLGWQQSQRWCPAWETPRLSSPQTGWWCGWQEPTGGPCRPAAWL